MERGGTVTIATSPSGSAEMRESAALATRDEPEVRPG